MAATCASCSAPILWARSSATGKPMPIDAAPVADGNILLVGGLAVVLGRLERDAVTTEPRYRSHFATCPSAGQFRKPKEVSRG